MEEVVVIPVVMFCMLVIEKKEYLMVKVNCLV